MTDDNAIPAAGMIQVADATELRESAKAKLDRALGEDVTDEFPQLAARLVAPGDTVGVACLLEVRAFTVQFDRRMRILFAVQRRLDENSIWLEAEWDDPRHGVLTLTYKQINSPDEWVDSS